jgi:hypothetical protein
VYKARMFFEGKMCMHARARTHTHTHTHIYFFFFSLQPLVAQGLLLIEASQSQSVRHTTLGRTPLDKWSAQHSVLYLTTHNTHKRHKSMLLVKFEHTYIYIHKLLPANMAKSNWESVNSITLENYYLQVDRWTDRHR